MGDREISPTLFARQLKSCGKSQDLTKGRHIHQLISQSVHHGNIFLQNLAMEMFGKCGSTEEARSVFNQITGKNIFSWNIILGAYAQNREIAGAREIFNAMPEKDLVSWNTIINAYAHSGYLREARELFDIMPHRSPITWNTMTAAYVHHGDLQEARRIFESTPDKNEVSWNIMIVVYARCGYLREAEEMFTRMKCKDVASWNAMITAYSQNGRLDEAWRIFKEMPVRDVVSWNSMITAAAQNGALEQAREMFNKMPKRSIVSWNAMIAAYATIEDCEEVVLLLGLMDLDGMEPNDATIVTILTVCGAVASLEKGKLVHISIAHKQCMSNVIVATAVITMYGSCKSLEDAWSVFEAMSKRTVVTWNVMITEYVHNCENENALMLYGIMNLEGVSPNEITFVSALDACAGLGALQQGKSIHSILEKETSYLTVNVVVGTAVVNMYSKCGFPDEAVKAFCSMPERNEVTWNSIMAIYAQYGRGNVSLWLFHLMLLEGLEPSEITFINIFSAFSHGAGIIAKSSAFECFMSVLQDYREVLCLDHYICMIDTLGRAGWLQAAEDLIKLMPFEPNALCWMTLLGACKLHGDSTRGQVAADNVIRLDPENPAPYVLFSSLLAREREVVEINLEAG